MRAPLVRLLATSLVLMVGADNAAFNRAFARAGLDQNMVRLSLMIGEDVLCASGSGATTGLYTACGYFESLPTEVNMGFGSHYQQRFGSAAPALNNIGVTLIDDGRPAEALPVLREAQAAYEKAGRPRNVLVARWMVAHTLRLLGRLDEALAAQRALEADWAAAGGSSPHVFDELAEIHAARGDPDRAAYYRALAVKAR